MIALLLVFTSVFLDDARALHVGIADAPVTDFKSMVLRVGDKWLEPVAVTRQPVAVAVVVEGTEWWMGKNALDGAFALMSPGFDRAVRDFKAPAGSTLTLMTYAADVEVRLHAIAFDHVPEYALGKQHDYRGRSGNALVHAVTRGLDELEMTTAPIKELIVITDGIDDDRATAPQRLRELVERGIAHGIKTHAIVRGQLFDTKEGDDWATLEPTIFIANYPDQIEPRLRTIFDAIARRMELTFAANELIADGRIYELVLEFGLDRFPVRFEMPGRRAPTAVTEPVPDTRWKLVVAGGAVLAMLGLAIAMAWRRAMR